MKLSRLDSRLWRMLCYCAIGFVVLGIGQFHPRTARGSMVGTPIDGVNAYYDNASGPADLYTASGYSRPGVGGSQPPFRAAGTYTIQHQIASANGQGNLNIESVIIGANEYQRAEAPDVIRLRRTDQIAGNQGAVQVIWMEAADGGLVNDSTVNLTPSVLNTTGGMSPMEQILTGQSDAINLGIDNLFVNDEDPDADLGTSTNNVERMDVIFTAGLTPTADNLVTHGFLVLDRGGNDRFKIAAITSLDAAGDPNGFGALRSVEWDSWGNSVFGLNYVVFRDDPGGDGMLKPLKYKTNDFLSGTLISFGELGIGADETFYGYALFPADVPDSTPEAQLIDMSYLSGALLATTNFNGGLDLVGGTTNVFSPGGAPTAVSSVQVTGQSQVGLSFGVWLFGGGLLLLSFGVWRGGRLR